MTIEEKMSALNSDNAKIVEIFIDALRAAQEQPK